MKPALILIDLQNDFLESRTLTPPAGELISRASVLVEGCRALSVPVVHVRTTVVPGSDKVMGHWRRAGRRVCIEGTEGHSAPEALRPLGSEKVIHKTYYSAFEDPKLDGILRDMKIDTVVLAGLYLHGCVRATVLDAYQRGLDVLVAGDAVASDDPLHGAVTRSYLEKRCAGFVSVDRLLEVLKGPGPGVGRKEDGAPVLPAMVIDNKEVLSEGLERLVHASPVKRSGARWGVPLSGGKEVARAAEAAHRASMDWTETSVAVRAKLLEDTARLLEARVRGFAREMAVEIGKPVMYGRAEVSRAVSLLRAVAKEAIELEGECGRGRAFRRRRPHGVVSIITSWNNPVAIPLGKIAPALFYGNTVVWKPAPAAASVALRLMEIFRSAGCPGGVLNLVNGGRVTAEALMSDPRIDAVSLTGSPGAGRSAALICSGRHIPLQAELGGNNASIVWSDCDLEDAAQKVAEAAFGQAGQRCTANRRVIVESRCCELFMEHLEAAVAALAWGDPAEDSTRVGPLISLEKRDYVEGVVTRAREYSSAVFQPHATGAQYEELFSAGAYYPPTVISLDDPGREVVQEETFGPVLVVERASDWDHAMELSNGVRQGLVAALFSGSKELQEKFLKQARAGVLKINSATADVGLECPFGGWKASGTGPPEHGPGNREFYTRAQSVYVDE